MKYKKITQLERLLDELYSYKEFCVNYGYKYDEADLFNMRVYPFQQFMKMRRGKNFKDQWAFDMQRMYSKESSK